MTLPLLYRPCTTKVGTNVLVRHPGAQQPSQQATTSYTHYPVAATIYGNNSVMVSVAIICVGIQKNKAFKQPPTPLLDTAIQWQNMVERRTVRSIRHGGPERHGAGRGSEVNNSLGYSE